MKQNNQPAVLSYYGLYLLQYLKENHPDKPADPDFISVRDGLAADTFEQARRAGYPVEGRRNWRCRPSCKGCISPSTVPLWMCLRANLPARCPSGKVQSLALKLLPKFKEIFSGYPLSDDFARSPEYGRLYTELTGAAAIYIEEYGV